MSEKQTVPDFRGKTKFGLWLDRLHCRLGWHRVTVNFNADIAGFTGVFYRYGFSECILCGHLSLVRCIGRASDIRGFSITEALRDAK